MSEVSLQTFTEQYLKELEQGSAALFAGAGLSKPSGFVDWKELMRDIADELGLSVDKESDLIAVAQYHVTQSGGSRTRLNKTLIEEFTKDSRPTSNHEIIADLPLDTIWTTNYDSLIEDAFRRAGKKVEKKTTQENLAQTTPNSDVTVYKMHGDIEQPQDAVLTKDDYETYNEKRPLFTTKLQGDLISKTFLFLGFSFNDPNIDYILSRIRALLGQNQREHFCIMKRLDKPKGRAKSRARAQYEYDLKKQSLRIADLQRYHVRVVLIDDYDEITTILRDLHRHVHRRSLFVSGSAHEYDPLGRDRVERLAHMLGREIITQGYNLVSGFGLGIGGIVAIGSLESLYASERTMSANTRTVLRPFPQEPPKGMKRAEFLTKYREEMIARSGFAIFLCGNKHDRRSNKTVVADGVLEEWRIAEQMRKYLIPIGATGYAAQQIWEEVSKSLDSFYPKGGVHKHFKTLGDTNSSNEEIVEAVFAIVKRVVR